jgi:hypothetical protein
MKKIALVLSLIPTVGFAAMNQQPFIAVDPTVGAQVLKTYTCQKYTDNAMNMTQGFLTDNPVIQKEIVIEQTKYEFTVEKNDLFKEGLKLSIPEGGAISGVAGNQRDMLFRRVDDDGKTYFIVYLTNDDREINRGVFLADCTRS